MAAVSCGVRSEIEQRSRPASVAPRPASGSRTATVLLANFSSSLGLSALAGVGRAVLGKDLVQGSRGFIHVCPLNDIGRQEAQHCLARAVDEDVSFHHL